MRRRRSASSSSGTSTWKERISLALSIAAISTSVRLDVGSYDLDTTRRSSARLKTITEQLFEPRDPRRPNGMGARAPDAARQAAALGHLAGECRLWTALRPAHRAWTADSPPPNIPTASTAGERNELAHSGGRF